MATYKINGDRVADLNEPAVFSFLAYNVGNFNDGEHSEWSGNDLDGYIAEWLQFFGECGSDVCLLSESRTYVDDANTASSKDRVYLPLYKYVSNYNPSVLFGVALLSNKAQGNVHSGLFTNRISSESKYLYAVIEINGVDLFVAVTHLNHTVEGREQDSINTRAAQIGELITLASNYDNVLIGGDFNFNSNTENATFTNAGYIVSNGGIFGDFNTWSADDPRYPCDNVAIKGDKLKLKDFKTIHGVTDHDHLAVMAKVLIG